MWIIFTKYKRNATEILIQCFSPQFTELNEAHVLPSQSILVIPLALLSLVTIAVVLASLPIGVLSACWWPVISARARARGMWRLQLS
jgi:hypothetical protein